MPIYPDIYFGPPKHFGPQKTKKKYIAIHSTENLNASARDEAGYAKRRPDSVSSHYYADKKEVIQSLDTDYRAFHAGSVKGNDLAIAWEFCGTARWSRQQWLDNINWPAVAKQMKKDLAAHSISPRDLTVSQIKAGNITGLITHDEMRQAWGGTDHWDPGPGFPMDHLIKLLTEDDMDLKDKVKTPTWARERWPDLGEYITVETALASGYSHARSGKDETYRQSAVLQAILAAVTGQDVVAAVKAELTKHDQNMQARLNGMGDQVAAKVAAALVPELDDLPAERLHDAVKEAIRTVLLEGVGD